MNETYIKPVMIMVQILTGVVRMHCIQHSLEIYLTCPLSKSKFVLITMGLLNKSLSKEFGSVILTC
jgi:hypothetical protein